MSDQDRHADASADACQCSEALDKLESYLDRESDQIDTDRLKAHLDECVSCLGEAEYEQRLRALLRRSCCETAPADLHVRVRSQITIVRAEFRTLD